jgi:hypothetical protein
VCLSAGRLASPLTVFLLVKQLMFVKWISFRTSWIFSHQTRGCLIPKILILLRCWSLILWNHRFIRKSLTILTVTPPRAQPLDRLNSWLLILNPPRFPTPPSNNLSLLPKSYSHRLRTLNQLHPPHPVLPTTSAFYLDLRLRKQVL